jgi:hypothetical protein
MPVPSPEKMWQVREALHDCGFDPQSVDGALALLAISGTMLFLQGYDREKYLGMAAIAYDASAEELSVISKEHGSA